MSLIVLGFAPRADAAGSGIFSLTGPMSVKRGAPVAAPLPDGRVLVAGGTYGLPASPHDTNDYFTHSAEFFNPDTGTFSGKVYMPVPGGAAAPLPGGRVLVITGNGGEVFDPATNTFSSAGIGPTSVSRGGAVAAPLPDGRVLVAGGYYFDGTTPRALASAEVFNPATNTFSSAGIGSMTVPRGNAAAAPLRDGRVLVAGGRDVITDPALSSAEVFDPATNTFSSTGIGSMSVPRFGAAAAALGDGLVLVVGGGSGPDLSAEVFDPATNTFSSTGIGWTVAPRGGAAAAPLPDGGALVAGAGGYSGDSQSAEVFTPVSCAGKPATIVGHGLGDQIAGTDKADVIIGTPESDNISGLGGNDLICGGEGHDTLNGGAGRDRLHGQPGYDTLHGNAGDDALKGGFGWDDLYGGPGKDTLKGGPGKDLLKGGPGKDKRIQ